MGSQTTSVASIRDIPASMSKHKTVQPAAGLTFRATHDKFNYQSQATTEIKHTTTMNKHKTDYKNYFSEHSFSGVWTKAAD